MAQDFAKHKQGGRAVKATPRKAQAQRHGGETPSRGRGVRLYLTGVVTGIFISFLTYLATLPQPAAPGEEVASAAQPQVEVPKPRFDFYTTLPQQKIELEPPREAVEPATDMPKPPAALEKPQPYYLQAGSFRQQDDAERRRAELLLLGLNPTIEQARGDSGTWFRVSLGPFDSPDAMARARSLLANQKIESVLLRRNGT